MKHFHFDVQCLLAAIKKLKITNEEAESMRWALRQILALEENYSIFVIITGIRAGTPREYGFYTPCKVHST